MKIKMLALVTLLGATCALPALALDLEQARASGLVGEKTDGYVAPIQGSAEVNALVAEVNAKRQQEYNAIALKNNQSATVVSKMAAVQLINKLPPGTSYQMPDGSWKKR